MIKNTEGRQECAKRTLQDAAFRTRLDLFPTEFSNETSSRTVFAKHYSPVACTHFIQISQNYLQKTTLWWKCRLIAQNITCTKEIAMNSRNSHSDAAVLICYFAVHGMNVIQSLSVPEPPLSCTLCQWQYEVLWAPPWLVSSSPLQSSGLNLYQSMYFSDTNTFIPQIKLGKVQNSSFFPYKLCINVKISV